MKKLLLTLSLAVAAVCLPLTTKAEETVLAEADFSTLTEGSEDSPKVHKYSFDYKGPTGWKVSTGTTGQAGGSLWVGDGGTLKSPNLSGVSTTNGAIKISVELKLNKTTLGMVKLAYGTSISQSAEVYTGEWTTVDFIVTPTSTSSYANNATISPFLVADGIFIKSVKISQSPEFLGIPTVYQPTDANGTSFTARWKAVTGATKYLLYVYSYNNSGDKVMKVDALECTGTSQKVEDLDPATTYYYVVRAANDSGISPDSEEIEVVKVIESLAKPIASINSCDTEGNFTATWGAVADADDYSVTIFKKVTLTEAGEANVLAETFDVFTEGTLSSVEYLYDRHPVSYTHLTLPTT